ncbi:MAG: DNA translocase FtsK, partial [Anaerolineae bacterium]|nr:DNA translocase FtsK [Anaerolineae bacterium]
KTSKKEPFWRRFPITLEPRLKEEIAGLLLMAVGVITLLNLLSVSQAQGFVIDNWSMLLRWAFGRGAFVATLALIAVGVALLVRGLAFLRTVPLTTVLGGALLFLTLLGLLHFFYPDPQRVAQEGQGGGYLGWAISAVLYRSLGDIGAFLVLVLLGLAGILLAASMSPAHIRHAAAALSSRASSLYQERVTPYLETQEGTEATPVEPDRLRPAAPALPEQGEPLRTVASQPVTDLKPAAVRVPFEERPLPSVDLLAESSPEVMSEADARHKMRIIEETLRSFGVPAKVVEISQGPTVTQFGIEPGYLERKGADGETVSRKVRVSKISALSKDLALALAAAPIRIEAPVPGRPIVGIEVPNEEISLVSLRSVIESEEFQRLDSPLKIALGQDVSGRSVSATLDAMPHLLIAGATGSGKSVCLNAIITCLLFGNAPSRLKLLMIDPKTVELIHFNGLPHLAAPVVTDMDRVLPALRWVMAEMDRRYSLLSRVAARNIDDYNYDKLPPSEQPLPYIIVAIDELADLMMMAPDEVERIICRLAQMSRATGIHLVIATQRPSVDVVTGLIKANFPARISFAVTSQVDSRVVLDTAGAETLLGQGDMLYMAPDSSKLVRLQGCFVSDEEIERVVQFWTKAVPFGAEVKAPWGAIEATAEENERDDLLDEAIALLRQQERASTSLLQRRLRIGYPRAARLMDQLEDEGIVGPPESGGRWREVLILEEDEEMEGDDWDL